MGIGDLFKGKKAGDDSQPEQAAQQQPPEAGKPAKSVQSPAPDPAPKTFDPSKRWDLNDPAGIEAAILWMENNGKLAQDRGDVDQARISQQWVDLLSKQADEMAEAAIRQKEEADAEAKRAELAKTNAEIAAKKAAATAPAVQGAAAPPAARRIFDPAKEWDLTTLEGIEAALVGMEKRRLAWLDRKNPDQAKNSQSWIIKLNKMRDELLAKQNKPAKGAKAKAAAAAPAARPKRKGRPPMSEGEKARKAEAKAKAIAKAKKAGKSHLSEKSQTVSVVLPKGIVELLDELAAAEDGQWRSRSEIIAYATRDYLDRKRKRSASKAAPAPIRKVGRPLLTKEQKAAQKAAKLAEREAVSDSSMSSLPGIQYKKPEAEAAPDPKAASKGKA